MGMFDYVRCEVELPDGKTNECEFQTKDFNDPYLETYTITAEGRLVHHRCRHEWVPENERPNFGKPGFYAKNGKPSLLALEGCQRAVHEGDVDLNFHGILNFYGGLNDEWREFNAKFTDGKLMEIVRVPDESPAPPAAQERP